jgi:hypothetical protein
MECYRRIVRLYAALIGGIRLELFDRWDKKALDVSYALAVTIEDISYSLDIYHEIEILNCYQPLNEVRVRVAT